MAERRSSAYERALNILARRAHFEAELRRKLQERGFQPPETDEAIARCKELGYLADRATAVALAHEWLRRGRGRLRIERDLALRGAEREAIEAALEGEVSPEAERAAAETALLARRRKRSGADPQSWEAEAANRRFLLNRGFSPDAVNRALRSREP